MKVKHARARASRSCSCSSLKSCLNGPRINNDYYGKFIPLREKILLGKLFGAVYNDITQMLPVCNARFNIPAERKSSKDLALTGEIINEAKSSLISHALKIVNTNKGVESGKISDFRSCYSYGSTIPLYAHDRTLHRHGIYTSSEVTECRAETTKRLRKRLVKRVCSNLCSTYTFSDWKKKQGRNYLTVFDYPAFNENKMTFKNYIEDGQLRLIDKITNKSLSSQIDRAYKIETDLKIQFKNIENECMKQSFYKLKPSFPITHRPPYNFMANPRISLTKMNNCERNINYRFDKDAIGDSTYKTVTNIQPVLKRNHEKSSTNPIRFALRRCFCTIRLKPHNNKLNLLTASKTVAKSMRNITMTTPNSQSNTVSERSKIIKKTNKRHVAKVRKNLENFNIDKVKTNNLGLLRLDVHHNINLNVETNKHPENYLNGSNNQLTISWGNKNKYNRNVFCIKNLPQISMNSLKKESFKSKQCTLPSAINKDSNKIMEEFSNQSYNYISHWSHDCKPEIIRLDKLGTTCQNVIDEKTEVLPYDCKLVLDGCIPREYEESINDIKQNGHLTSHCKNVGTHQSFIKHIRTANEQTNLASQKNKISIESKQVKQRTKSNHTILYPLLNKSHQTKISSGQVASSEISLNIEFSQNRKNRNVYVPNGKPYLIHDISNKYRHDYSPINLLCERPVKCKTSLSSFSSIIGASTITTTDSCHSFPQEKYKNCKQSTSHRMNSIYYKNSFYALNIKVNNTVKNERQYKLEQYECEPGACYPAPGECDPIECDKLIKKRLMRKTLKFSTTEAKSHHDTSDNDQNAQESVLARHSPKRLTSLAGRHAGRRAVRIDSNFSFGIEFSKGSDEPAYENVSELKPDKHGKSTYTHENRSINQGTLAAEKRHHTESQFHKDTQHVGVNTHPKRCFCTLKLHKMGRVYKEQGAAANLYQPKPNVLKEAGTVTAKEYSHNAAAVVELDIEPYECEPGTCIPGKCNPHECLKRIKRRKIKTRDVQSHMAPSTTAPTQKKRDAPRKKRRQSSKQACRIESNFSFSIEFVKYKPGEKLEVVAPGLHENPESTEKKKTKYLRSMFHYFQKTKEPQKNDLSFENQTSNKSVQSNGRYRLDHDVMKVKEVGQNPKVRHRLAYLDPYECEPGTCIPGECNPYECLEIIKRRDMHTNIATNIRSTHMKEESTTTHKKNLNKRKTVNTTNAIDSGIQGTGAVHHEKLSKTGAFLKRCFCTAKLHGIEAPPPAPSQAKKVKGKPKKLRKSKNISQTIKPVAHEFSLYTSSESNAALDESEKLQDQQHSSNNLSPRVVRIGSNFKFNIEFSRTLSGMDGDGPDNTKPNTKQKILAVAGTDASANPNTRVIGSGHLQPSVQSRESQVFREKTEDRGSGIGIVLRRCFCTLSLQRLATEDTKKKVKKKLKKK